MEGMQDRQDLVKSFRIAKAVHEKIHDTDDIFGDVNMEGMHTAWIKIGHTLLDKPEVFAIVACNLVWTGQNWLAIWSSSGMV